MSLPTLDFDDGDVSVILTSSQKYQLHSSILRRFSSFFQEELDENNARPITSKQRSQGMVVRWQAILVKSSSEDDIGTFDVAGVNTKGQYPHANPEILELTHDSPVVKHYKNVISACYGRDISLKEDTMDHLLQDTALLMNVAENLGCVGVVATKAENVLLKQGQPLFQSISRKSTAWADLAFRIQSEVIFKEAIVHLVGQWNKYRDETNFRPQILALCQSKHTDLERTKKAQEMLILGYYPTSLKRDGSQVAIPTSSAVGPGSRGGGAASLNTRAHSYGLDILAWMALALFRHYMSQSICGGLARSAADGGYSFYHELHTGGRDAYLDHHTINLFLEHFPMSSKARTAMEQHLLIMKHHVRQYVAPLIVHNSQLDVTKTKIAYLTCCKVEKYELPWLQEPSTEKAEALPGAQATQTSSTASHAQSSPSTNALTGRSEPVGEPARSAKKKKGPKKIKVKSSFSLPLKRSQSPDMLEAKSAEESSKRVKI